MSTSKKNPPNLKVFVSDAPELNSKQSKAKVDYQDKPYQSASNYQKNVHNDSFGESSKAVNLDTRNSTLNSEDKLAMVMKKLDLEEYLDTFIENKITFADLLLLNKDDLVELNLKLGPRTRLTNFIDEYKKGNNILDDNKYSAETIFTPMFKNSEQPSQSYFPNEISLNSERSLDTHMSERNIFAENSVSKGHKKTSSMYNNASKEKVETYDLSRQYETNNISRNSAKLEKTFEGLNNDIEQFLRNYKHQKEKSKQIQKKIPKNVRQEQISSNKNPVPNYFTSDATLKEEPVRNLKDELKKSSSVSRQQIVPSQPVHRIIEKTAKNSRNNDQSTLLIKINQQKEAIKYNLTRCEDSIKEKKKMLELLENEDLLNTDLFDKVLTAEDNSLDRTQVSHSAADFLNDTSISMSGGNQVYVKRRLSKKPSILFAK